MKIYFVASQYKKKTIDINWSPLNYKEANDRLEQLASRNKELTVRNQANEITYKLLEFNQLVSVDKEGNISRD